MHIFFTNRLNCFINCEIHIVAVLRFNILFVSERHIRTSCILCRDNSTGSTRQIAVIFVLDTLKSLIVTARKTDYGRCKAVFRVISLVIIKQLNNTRTAVILFQSVNKLKNLFTLIRLDSSFDNNIMALLFCIVKHIVVFKVKNFRKTFCGSLTLFVILKVDRRHYHLPNRCAFGKNIAVCVINCSSFCGNSCVGKLKVNSRLLKFTALNGGEVCKS